MWFYVSVVVFIYNWQYIIFSSFSSKVSSSMQGTPDCWSLHQWRICPPSCPHLWPSSHWRIQPLSNVFLQVCYYFVSTMNVLLLDQCRYILSVGVRSQIFCQMRGKCIFSHFKLWICTSPTLTWSYLMLGI